MLCTALRAAAAHAHDEPAFNPVPRAWRIEPPKVLAGGPTALGALVAAGRNLVDLATLLAAILLAHVCASWWAEEWYRRRTAALAEGERGTVPRKEGKKASLYVGFTLAVAAGVALLKAGAALAGLGLWQSAPSLSISRSLAGADAWAG
jgi:dolichol kinase